MAYEFLCGRCGCQETPHLHGVDPESDGDERIEGSRFTLNKCPGFSYQKKDAQLAIRAFLNDPEPIANFPKYLKIRAECQNRRDWIARGFPDGEPHMPDKHLVLLSNGVVVDIGS